MSIYRTHCDEHRNLSAHRKYRKRPVGLVASIGAGIVGATLFGAGVFASWTPSAAMSSGAYNAANLAITAVDINGTTFSAGVTNLLPGDYLNRYVKITNNGTVDQTFTGSVTGAGGLSTAMNVAIDTCPTAWNADGTCTGTITSIKPSTVTNPVTNFAFPSMAANAVTNARFKFTLDGSAAGTYQGTNSTQVVNIAGTATAVGNRDRTAG